MGVKEPIVPPQPDPQWRIVERWQEYEGELRANLLRIAGIGLFYGIELLNYYGLRLGSIEMPKVVELPFHQSVTALAVAWSAVCLGVLLCLKMRVFPAGLKFFSTTCRRALFDGHSDGGRRSAQPAGDRLFPGDRRFDVAFQSAAGAVCHLGVDGRILVAVGLRPVVHRSRPSRAPLSAGDIPAGVGVGGHCSGAGDSSGRGPGPASMRPDSTRGKETSHEHGVQRCRGGLPRVFGRLLGRKREMLALRSRDRAGCGRPEKGGFVRGAPDGDRG